MNTSKILGFKDAAATLAMGTNGTINPTTDTASAMVFPAATAGNGASGGISQTASQYYSEAGYFKLASGAVASGAGNNYRGAIYDNTFAGGSSDIANSDCIHDGINDYSNTVVNGKYGCYITQTANVVPNVRFTPSHFNVVPTVACAASSFTYSGQPFAGMKIQAKNGAYNGITQYYRNPTVSNGLAKTVTFSVSDPSGTLSPTVIADTSFTNGEASPATTFTFTSTATVPKTITLHAVEAAGGDGICSGTGVGCSALADPTAAIWSGRLRMLSGSGSNLLDLYLPMRLERYESAALAWQPNALDKCTNLTLSALTLTPAAGSPGGSTVCVQDTGNPGASTQGCAAAAPIAARRYHNQPGTLGTPSSDFNLWLQPVSGYLGIAKVMPTATPTPTWLYIGSPSPSAIATFGNPTSGPVIYRKE